MRRWRCGVLRCWGERGRAVGSLQGRREVLAAVAVGTAGSEGTIEAEAAERQSERGRERGADNREMMRGKQRSGAGAGGGDMGG